MSAPSDRSRVLADVNVWLATLVEQHPHHHRAVQWWRGRVVPAGRKACFCRLTQLGFLRLLTNETVMGPSRRTPQQAWRDYDQMLAQRPVEYLEEPAGLDRVLREDSHGEVPSPSLWTDAYLAAFARVAGLRLATFDRGFRRFEGLQLEPLWPNGT